MKNKTKAMRQAKRALKRTDPYLQNRADSTDPEENYQLDYVLAREGRAAPDDALAYAHFEDIIISFYPLCRDAHVSSCWNWAFTFDEDLFCYLELGYELAGMSLAAHHAAWDEISDYNSGDIVRFPIGMQRYLLYCKRNGITLELLRKESRYDGKDVLALYGKSVMRAVEAGERDKSAELTAVQDYLGQAIAAMLEKKIIQFSPFAWCFGMVDMTVASEMFTDKEFTLTVLEDDWNGGPAECVAKELVWAVLNEKLKFVPLTQAEEGSVQ